jgi:uncharacterized caspase-like protein
MRNLFCLLLLFLNVTANAQTKGAKTISAKAAEFDTAAVDFNKRFALIIGNRDYAEAPLTNTINDSDSMSRLLTRYGFKVITRNEVTLQQMRTLVDSFSQAVKKERGVALFYFSGHGLQYEAMNYILPLDCKVNTGKNIPSATMGLDSLLKDISYSLNGMNIVILDACRNSPWYNRIAELQKGPSYQVGSYPNTLVLFSTSSGNVAEDGTGHNSPFTEALLEVISRNDSFELMQIAKQVTRSVQAKTDRRQTPQYVGTMTEDFYFRKTAVHKPVLYILSIGISDYTNKNIPNLMYADRAAQQFAWAFEKQNAGLYDTVSTTLLVNKDASYYNIYNKIARIRSQVMPGDVLFVYFSGHIISDGNNVYLVPRDGDIEYPSTQTIDQDRLLSILADLPAKSILFLEGPFSHSLGEMDSRLSSARQRLINNMLNPENNVIVFTSTSEGQVSMESAEWNGTAFTYGIFEAMQKAQSEIKAGYIDVSALFKYVRMAVRDITQGQQTPAFYAPKGFNNFIIGRAMAVKPKETNVISIGPR